MRAVLCVCVCATMLKKEEAHSHSPWRCDSRCLSLYEGRSYVCVMHGAVTSEGYILVSEAVWCLFAWGVLVPALTIGCTCHCFVFCSLQCVPMEKPAPVKTHLRNMIVVPDMIGAIVGVYNGKEFNGIEIKPEMTGHHLAEFALSYKPTRHGRPGLSASHTLRFIPL